MPDRYPAVFDRGAWRARKRFVVPANQDPGPFARVQDAPPLLRTPDGIPDGWYVWVDGLRTPVLARREASDA